jgi:hypothetical protein
MGLTVHVTDTAGAGAGKLDLGPERLRASDAQWTRFTRRDET